MCGLGASAARRAQRLFLLRFSPGRPWQPLPVPAAPRAQPGHVPPHTIAMGILWPAGAGASRRARAVREAVQRRARPGGRWGRPLPCCPWLLLHSVCWMMTRDVEGGRGCYWGGGVAPRWFCRIHLAEGPSCLGPTSLGSRWPVPVHGPR